MHVKDLLDYLDIRIKLPQHWYSTDINDEYSEAEIIENGDIIKLGVKLEDKTRLIIIDVNDGMQVVTEYPNGKTIGVKYMKHKDDFEYVGHILDLKKQ